MSSKDQTVVYLTEQLQLSWAETDQLKAKITSLVEDNRYCVKNITLLKAEVDRLKAIKVKVIIKGEKKKKIINDRQLELSKRYVVNGKKLHEYMKKNDIDTIGLSDVMSTNINTIYNWLHNKSTSMRNIKTMAEFFQVDIAELVTGRGTRKVK